MHDFGVLGLVFTAFCGVVGLLALVLRARHRLASPPAPQRNRWEGKLPRGKAATCQQCAHWDLDEGQNALCRHTAFMEAARVLTPNQMQRTAVDSAGEVNAGREKLPLLEDKWSYVGACIGREEMRHRTDSCLLFLDCDSHTGQLTEPGDDPRFAHTLAAEAEAQRARAARDTVPPTSVAEG